jgi:hypothetical protein
MRLRWGDRHGAPLLFVGRAMCDDGFTANSLAGIALAGAVKNWT